MDNTNKNQNERKTIEYYNSNTEEFYESTVTADMSVQYKLFEKYLGDGARILDCGCGSGRSKMYFKDNTSSCFVWKNSGIFLITVLK